jgi:hypothetical protein
MILPKYALLTTIDLLYIDYQIVMCFHAIKHPPTPFKGGLALMVNPPLKGVGGCSMVFEISKK